MHLIAEPRLRTICRSIVLAMGAPTDIADIVTDVLVKADLKGVDSHGCRLLHENYVRNMKAGRLIPAARAEIIEQNGATTIMDARWGFGHPPARAAAQHAVESARQFGIGAASVIHTVHIARLGEYAEQIAAQNMLGIVLCHAGPVTTPYGGMKRMFGTNPLAMAVPRPGGRTLLADWATSAKAVNKLMIYRQRGEKLADGVLLDKDGYPTNDPAAFFDGGFLLAMGGYKGYAINLFIEIIGGLILGAGCGSLLNQHPGNGSLFIAMDITRWRPLDAFSDELEQLLAATKSVPVAPGANEVLLPGELEERAEAERRRTGVPLDDVIWAELQQAAGALHLPASLFTDPA